MMSDGCLHGEQRDNLQEVVLNDVSDRSDFFVETSAAMNAESLGHGDLDALYVLPVPDGLEKRIGEAEIKKVLDRFLTKEMIDPKNGRLRETFMDGSVERLG